jgi:transcriptional regulator with XRE-family HTH domain
MTDNNDKAVGKKIRDLRRSAGLTQVGLSEKADIESNTIARLERGEHTASTLTLQKLAKALNVKVSDILDY